MTALILSLLLAVGVSADHLPMKLISSLSNKISEETGVQCDFPFQVVGSNCFFISEEQKSFDEAKLYCESIGHGHSYEVSLAMLDYEEAEDQALIDVIATKENTYWVGGKSEDGINWRWLDNHKMNLQATYWYCEEPDEEQNSCAALEPYTSSHGSRAYLHAHSCAESLNFICQTGSYVNFRRIGNHYYFISEEARIPHASWQNARDFCQSLAIPEGYHHADLAVLGLPDQDSHNLIQSLVEFSEGSITWFGAYADPDCEYHWVDGRDLPASSMYWEHGQPSCGDSHYTAIWKPNCKRAYLGDSSKPDNQHPFICQLFSNAQ